MSVSLGRSDLDIEYYNVGARDNDMFTIRSGSVMSGGEIANRLREGLFNAAFNGIVEAFAEFEPTVAMDTGRMRQALRYAVANSLNSQRGNSVITFNMSDAVNVASGVVEYTKYHYETGPQGQSSYANPTTKNPVWTEPFKSANFIPIARRKIIARLKTELQLQGLAVS